MSNSKYRMFDTVRWASLFGYACLAGIGFTMSLFISMLAFTDSALIETAKIGILAGSLIAGILGALILKLVREN